MTKLGRLNHIGVATPSIADSIVFYRDVMGLTKLRTKALEIHGKSMTIFRCELPCRN